VNAAGPIVWVTYHWERPDMPTLMRRPARVGPLITAYLAAAVLAAALAGCGTNTRTIIKEPGPKVTITVTAAPRTVVKTVTRTLSGNPSIACSDSGAGSQVQPGVLVAGLPDDTTCTVTVVSPEGGSHLGEIQIKAPSGDWSDYNMLLTGSG
jgi:hypothetical protein